MNETITLHKKDPKAELSKHSCEVIFSIKGLLTLGMLHLADDDEEAYFSDNVEPANNYYSLEDVEFYCEIKELKNLSKCEPTITESQAEVLKALLKAVAQVSHNKYKDITHIMLSGSLLLSINDEPIGSIAPDGQLTFDLAYPYTLTIAGDFYHIAEYSLIPYLDKMEAKKASQTSTPEVKQIDTDELSRRIYAAQELRESTSEYRNNQIYLETDSPLFWEKLSTLDWLLTLSIKILHTDDKDADGNEPNYMNIIKSTLDAHLADESSYQFYVHLSKEQKHVLHIITEEAKKLGRSIYNIYYNQSSRQLRLVALSGLAMVVYYDGYLLILPSLERLSYSGIRNGELAEEFRTIVRSYPALLV